MTDTKEAAPAKSIIDAKYRDGRYKQKDWLATVIGSVTDATKVVDRKTQEGDETVVKKVEVSAGIDIDKLFELAEQNGLDVAKYDDQREAHGFPGRFRMTVRNMLQKIAKQRHGIMVGDKFVVAPADWLDAKSAPAEPTHTQAGEKIAKPKPAKEEGEAPKAAKPAKAPPAAKKK